MGGAVTNLAAVKHGLATYDPDVVQGTVLDRAEIDRQIELYRTRDADERREIVGLQPNRAEVILAGACIVRTVLAKLGRERLTVSDRGLRHGLLVERFPHPGLHDGGQSVAYGPCEFPQSEAAVMSGPCTQKPRLPPRWFIRLFWVTHRWLCRLSGGRLGLWRPKRGKWGALRLTTVGRRTGRERPVIVGYFEDGPDLVTLAMNGWGDGEPGWWLDLEAQPEVRADLVDGRAWSGLAPPGARSANACGTGGVRFTRASTPTPPAAPWRPLW